MPRAPTLLLVVAAALLFVGAPRGANERRALSSALDESRPAREPPPLTSALDVASYTMDVRLATDHRTIDGRAIVRWVNTSNTSTSELWWHLYMNAFAGPRTLFMRSLGEAGHRGNTPGEPGRIEVRAMRLSSGEDLLASATNDPEVPEDATQLRTPLPRPVPAGGSLEITVEWRTLLPTAFARTGYWRDFAFAGQWFPKLAVLEQDGRWAHFPYHALSEFYADFGTYDVTLTVPRGDIVGATGERQGVPLVLADGRERHRYVARGVHDFAWTAWARYRERTEAVGNVRVRVLYAPGLDSVAARDLAALRVAMPTFARRFGPYPYPILTVVLPPPGARGIEGMEYPTLITTGGIWFAPSGVHEAEYIAIHEYAHQYFYGLLASDEWSWPFLDEGLTEYATGLAMGEMFPRDRELLDTFAGSLGYWAYQGGFSAMIRHPLPIASRADAFPSFESYGAHVYRRAATIFRTAEWVYGADAVERALALYSARWRFRHPTPSSLLDAFREIVGHDAVERYLRPALFGDASLDYAVTALVSTPLRNGHAGRAIVRRTRGTLEVPVEIELERADGARSRVRWEGRGPEYVLSYAGPSPLRAVRVDPDRRIPLDLDRLDDARLLPGHSSPTLPMSARLAYWIGLFLRAVGP